MGSARIMIAAPKSGSGKTMVTCALIYLLKSMGINTVSFKCGPDYIDTMFHSSVLGVKSRNLDIFMSNEDTVRYLLSKNSAEAEFSVIEGVMGYYDGLGGVSDTASSYHLASCTKTPVILVIDAKGASLTAVSVLKGIAEFRKDSNIKGVILNRVSKSTFLMLKDLIESETGIKAVGYLPELKEAAFESRYLGLSTSVKKEEVLKKISILSDKLKECVDLEAVFKMAGDAPEVCHTEYVFSNEGEKIKIAVAYDEAFNFYYEDNFEILREMGAEIVFFSPLNNEPVPENSCALIIGGGYPEEFAESLSQNTVSKQSIKKAIAGGMPLIAECGGFMYLCKSIETDRGVFDMCGIFDISCRYSGRLGNFGYINLVSNKESVFGKMGTEIKGHEFHYFITEKAGDAFAAVKPVSGRSWKTGFSDSNMYAGFPHIYFYSNTAAAKEFIKKSIEYKSGLTDEY
ncbi:cobyrinate a,c-diamide synthase [Lachnospiraceae bacterium NSJ-143]|nr:cobyrinate a,c-diamide synthase [Lachnospiraceae bacterium NSJ-143]